MKADDCHRIDQFIMNGGEMNHKVRFDSCETVFNPSSTRHQQ